jgi:hypothetical protein
MSVLISLQLLSETFLISARTERDMKINLYWFHTNYQSLILMKPELTRQIFEKITNMKFHKENRSVGAELFQAKGRTDIMKPTAPLPNFANAPKKVRKKPNLLLLNKKHNSELLNGNGKPDPAAVYFACSATAQLEPKAHHC